MKKIIRLLANISGVQKDIEIETRKRIGNQLVNESFYFQTENKTQQIIQSFGNLLKEDYSVDGAFVRKKHFGF